MQVDWIFSDSRIKFEELLPILLPILCFDVPRYLLGAIGLLIVDLLRRIARYTISREPHLFKPGSSFRPSVSLVIAGHNEADTIAHTLESVSRAYPNLQLIVVDDGSTDGMAKEAHRFARSHPGTIVLSRRERGGKSSALNFALPFVRSEVVVCLDADSHLDPGAIEGIVQPMADARIGAVCGNLMVRNASTNLVTRLQSLEYRRSIFMGRQVASILGILGIVSGAFGAFRTDALRRVQGWDVGPGEDGDLCLRLRKLGYQIAFTPYATCHTNAPTTWSRLFKQRRRWEWAVITFECRKHIDLINPWSPGFLPSNALLLLDRWLYGVVLPLSFWFWSVWFLTWAEWEEVRFVLLAGLGIYFVIDLALHLVILYFSRNRREDLSSFPWLPCMLVYQLFLRFVTAFAVVEELFWRKSYQDNFVPAKVRSVTWHW
jgi:poly-beta-1,6-N-acetyl-D-glucosamine synthase